VKNFIVNKASKFFTRRARVCTAWVVTDAAQAEVPTLKIRARTGHASDAMLNRYIRDGEIFIGNAAGALL
jgi:hypothetical protein